MSTTATLGDIRVEEIAPLSGDESRRLSVGMADALVALLRELEPDDWDKPTDCELWTVRDVVAHLVGWQEALVSMREMGAQMQQAFKRSKELGNVVDAQNQVQVDSRRGLATDELIEKLEQLTPPAARFRHNLGRTIGFVPIYSSYLGGWMKLSYLTNVVFLRDIYMHRVDIAGATAKEIVLGQPERRLIEDVVRDWFGRTAAQARLVLEGPGGGNYVSGTPVATLTADAVEFTRFLFGRAGKEVVHVEGDGGAANRWLETFFPV